MHRRRALAVLAGATIAGCSEPIGPDAVSPDTDETPTDSPNDTDTPPDDPPEEPPDPEPEEELTDAERAAQEAIEAGDALLAEALNTYAAEGNGDSFLSVRASTIDVRWVPTARHIRAANAEFDRAHRQANEQQREQIAALRSIGTFLRTAVRAQEPLGDAYEALGDVLIAHQGDTISTVSWRRLTERIATAEGALATVFEAADPEAATASTALSVAAYEQKLAQFEAERAAFRRIRDCQDDYRAGHSAWLSGERQYTRRYWNDAERHFTTTTDRFGAAAATLAGPAVDDERFDRRLDTLRNIAVTLADASVAYRDSAVAYNERDRETGDERRRAGRRILRGSDAVAEMPSVRRIEDYDGP